MAAHYGTAILPDERTLDLLVVWEFGPFADEKLWLETLYEDAYVIVAGVQNPWARRRRIELAELVNESGVVPPPESFIGAMAMEAFRAEGLDYSHATVVSYPPAVRMSLLATGRFLTVFPTSTLTFPAPRPELKALPVELPMARVPIGILLSGIACSTLSRGFSSTPPAKSRSR